MSLIISGPSGVGKSYIVRQLTNKFFCGRVIPTTTRAMRVNETEGVDYYYTDEDKYQYLEEMGEFFMSNKFLNARYGIRINEIARLTALGLVPVTEQYTPVVEQYLKVYPDSVAIFLMPSSMDLIRKRMIQRGDTYDAIDYRLKGAEAEVAYFNEQGNKHYNKCMVIEDDRIDDIVKEISYAAGLPERTR